VHDDAAASETDPAAHGAHGARYEPSEKLPGAQGTGAPSGHSYPAGQPEHTLAPACKPMHGEPEHEPGAHGVHDSADARLYVFGPHKSHCSAPAPLYVPGAHLWREWGVRTMSRASDERLWVAAGRKHARRADRKNRARRSEVRARRAALRRRARREEQHGGGDEPSGVHGRCEEKHAREVDARHDSSMCRWRVFAD
jgi:hypothetical protein